MKPTNLDIKNLAAGALILISSYAAPEISEHLNIKKYIFIFGVIFSISTVFFSKEKSTKGKTFHFYRYNIDFPFFKTGLASVLLALLAAALSFQAAIAMLFIFTGVINLIISVIFERQIPIIFKAGDEIFAKKIIALGYYLVGGAFVSYFLFQILNVNIFFISTYIFGILCFLTALFFAAFFIYRMLLIKY